FVFTPLSSAVSWNFPFIITGVLTLVALVENSFAFRTIKEEIRVDFAKVKNTLRSRDVWAVIISVIGMNATYYVIVQFSVTYAENYLGFSSVLAGTVSSLI